MDAFGAVDEESAELRKLNAEVVSTVLRSACSYLQVSSTMIPIASRAGRNLFEPQNPKKVV